MKSLEWVPWGQTRLTPRGVETAFHHPLIAIRVKDDLRVRLVNPGVLLSRTPELEIESWRPMAWAASGRRGWPFFTFLGPHSAFYGTDGHMFATIQGMCEQLFEGDVLGAEGTTLWQRLIRRRVEWCRDNNIVYRHLVIPEHHSVYADMIPDAPSLSDQRPLIRIMSGLEPHIRETIVYPLEKLIAGRANFDTFMRHDSHFTGYGAFLCYDVLIKTLDSIGALKHLREEDLEEHEIFVGGDVARAMGKPGRKIASHHPPKVKSNSIVKGTSFKTFQVDVYASELASKRTLVMFRTSNSSHLIPYLLRHFSRITAVGARSVFYDLLESEQPDVVIAEMPERYLAGWRPSPDCAIHQGVPDDDIAFEKETGHALPLPRT